MSVALLVGPLAAIVGVVAIFFVLRRKSVDKRSMYSSRRSQIEHKVRAARQRTLAPQGKAEKQPETPPEVAPTSIFAPSPNTPRVTYEPSAYQPPPAAPAAPVKETGASSWDVPPHPTSPFAAPEAPPAPVEEVWVPAPVEPPPPREVWTPASAQAEPTPPPVEPTRPATPAASPGSWSVVSEAAKEQADTPEAHPKKKGRQDPSSSSWQLASGNAPGEAEAEEEDVKTPSALVAIAQYAVLVVGLVMVLIGVFVMIANSHVT